ncbi:uncharacterized protein CTRU02_214272 [Colletotrichum truncatum]|uniref:Uncharacterized protein n=1 Tax=Colletotrichum truncatum TaxID=5467 RepID=A0ACC3YI07_COLTU
MSTGCITFYLQAASVSQVPSCGLLHAFFEIADAVSQRWSPNWLLLHATQVTGSRRNGFEQCRRRRLTNSVPGLNTISSSKWSFLRRPYTLSQTAAKHNCDQAFTSHPVSHPPPATIPVDISLWQRDSRRGGFSCPFFFELPALNMRPFGITSRPAACSMMDRWILQASVISGSSRDYLLVFWRTPVVQFVKRLRPA